MKTLKFGFAPRCAAAAVSSGFAADVESAPTEVTQSVGTNGEIRVEVVGQSVDVVKDPSSVQYGKMAPGGVVNYVPKGAKLDKLGPTTSSTRSPRS